MNKTIVTISMLAVLSLVSCQNKEAASQGETREKEQGSQQVGQSIAELKEHINELNEKTNEKIERLEKQIEGIDQQAPQQAQPDPVATIAGEVKNPGRINLGEAGKLDILTALHMAGGFGHNANQELAIMQRKVGEGKYWNEEIRVRDISAGKIPMVFINEGDILIIKEADGQ